MRFHLMADDTYQAELSEDDEGDEAEGPSGGKDKREKDERSADISKRKGVRKQLIELYREVEAGYSDQSERADDIQDYWDVYNCILTGNQFYNGNSQIFVPIVKNAINARKTRFTNQIFPQSQRCVEVTSQDGTYPNAMMSLLEYYVKKARLRTQVMPALCKAGDIEGQYTVYIEWVNRTRNVTWKSWEQPTLPAAPGEPEIENPAAEEVEVINEEEITTGFPSVEVISDNDLLVLPQTADSIEDALARGGSVTIIRRWSKAMIEQMMTDGVIREDAGEALLSAMTSDDDNPATKKPKFLEAAGIMRRGGQIYAQVYQTYSMLKVKGKRQLCECFFGGEQQQLGARRNPLWSDKVPILSIPVEKIAGGFKGISKVKDVADLQYAANDAINEAADSAAYAMMPIVMTDPTKNPRVGSMVLSLAAIWETSPNDTKFAEFPQLWEYGMQQVAACKAEVAQTLSVSPAAITGGGASSKSKPSQAEIAQEQQIDILTTADAVTVLEEGILTPMLEMFVEMDHQYRDEDLTVKAFGPFGIEVEMETIPPVQFEKRYSYRWFGVEQARSAQQIQQQIAGMNVIRGIPPQQLKGYEINLVPIVQQLVENTFGPRLAPLIFQSPAQQMPVPVEQENAMLSIGYEVPTHAMDDDQQHIQAHTMIIQGPDGKPVQNARKIQAHIWAHIQQAQQKMQAQMAAQQGEPGIPGGAMGGQPQPGVAGTPRIGAQPGQATGGQGPPGMIHHDQLKDPAVAPRL
jgi:hypothetical protein